MEQLKRFPFFLLMACFLGYLGLQAYLFQNSSDGAVSQHQNRLTEIRTEIENLKKKIIEAKEFEKTLEAKKEELRSKVKRMFEYESLFADKIEVPILMKLFVTEAKRLNIKIDKIEPMNVAAREYYFEQEFKITMSGDYNKYLLFMNRIARMQRLIRVSELSMVADKTDVFKGAPIVKGILNLKAYRYSNSKEDSMAGAFK